MSSITRRSRRFNSVWAIIILLAFQQDREISQRSLECAGWGRNRIISSLDHGFGHLYARVSTSGQFCERQISELIAFAERGGYDVVGVFNETASGASANRAARKEIIDLAQARLIDAVLVSELSRWSRSTQDLLDTLNRSAGWKGLGCRDEWHDLRTRHTPRPDDGHHAGRHYPVRA